MKVKERISNYGYKSLTDEDLLNLLKWKGTKEEFFRSQKCMIMCELINRKEKEDIKIIKSSGDAFKFFAHMQTDDREQFWAMYLNNRNQVKSVKFFSKGSMTGCVVDIPAILKDALLFNCKNIIIAHNHPSGNLQPSNEDRLITKKIQDAAKLIDMEILDHLIISSDGYMSFSDSGYL